MQNPGFSPESERSMLHHMNEGHADSNLMYAKVYGHLWSATAAQMVALDKAGMDLEVTLPDGAKRIRIPFSHLLADEGEAQSTLVEMSLHAQERLVQRVQQR